MNLVTINGLTYHSVIDDGKFGKGNIKISTCEPQYIPQCMKYTIGITRPTIKLYPIMSNDYSLFRNLKL